MSFIYTGPRADIADRELLGQPVAAFHDDALRAVGDDRDAGFAIHLGGDLLFDEDGLHLLRRAVRGYAGTARRLRFQLQIDAIAVRDFYSLQATLKDGAIELPVRATRDVGDDREDVVEVVLPVQRFPMPFPRSFAEATEVSVVGALLQPVCSPHDVLFAQQTAVIGAIARRVRMSPLAILRGLLSRRPGLSLAQRAGLAFRSVHRDADVHPTAVVEGSVIEAGARIGAHCTVRYSWIGADARLHDGARVEYAVVGAGTWLMHDLVLYRCATEREVFLIHGPYQFSLFHRGSAAFATILMDYRPDGRPIRVMTSGGMKSYGGRLLGAVYEEGARTLGGTLLAPGRVVPKDTWLGADPTQIHAVHVEEGQRLPTGALLGPADTRRRGPS